MFRSEEWMMIPDSVQYDFGRIEGQGASPAFLFGSFLPVVSHRLVWIEFCLEGSQHIALKTPATKDFNASHAAVPRRQRQHHGDRISGTFALQSHRFPAGKWSRNKQQAWPILRPSRGNGLESNQILVVWAPDASLQLTGGEGDKSSLGNPLLCATYENMIHDPTKPIRTGSSDTDCCGTSANEFGGRVNVTRDWRGLEWPDLWQQCNWGCVLSGQSLALADDGAAQWSQVLLGVGEELKRGKCVDYIRNSMWRALLLLKIKFQGRDKG